MKINRRPEKLNDLHFDDTHSKKIRLNYLINNIFLAEINLSVRSS